MTAPRRRILTSGTDPDPRFTLANERTFLAWIRTALGTIAAGIAVDVFAADVVSDPWRRVVALVLIALGTVIAGASVAHWYRVESALRARRRLPLPLLAPMLVAGIVAAGIIVAIILIVRL